MAEYITLVNGDRSFERDVVADAADIVQLRASGWVEAEQPKAAPEAPVESAPQPASEPVQETHVEESPADAENVVTVTNEN